MDTEPPAPEQKQVPAPPPPVEDDFGNESLGERQPQVCSMEEGCVVCQ